MECSRNFTLNNKTVRSRSADAITYIYLEISTFGRNSVKLSATVAKQWQFYLN